MIKMCSSWHEAWDNEKTAEHLLRGMRVESDGPRWKGVWCEGVVNRNRYPVDATEVKRLINLNFER